MGQTAAATLSADYWPACGRVTAPVSAAARGRCGAVRAQDGLSMATATEGLSALEIGVRRIQAMASNRFVARISRALRKELRQKLGRSEQPTAAIIDSQSVKTALKGEGRGL